MDNSGTSGQGLPLDISQTGYGGTDQQESISFPLDHHRRSSCEFDRNISGTISYSYRQRSSAVPYYSDDASRWKDVPGTSTSTDVYNLLSGFDQQTGPQRCPNRHRLEKCVSKSLDLGSNPSGAPATISRRQSLDATLDLSTRSNLYNVVKGDETTTQLYGDMGLSSTRAEHRAERNECREQTQYSQVGLSACMYPQTQAAKLGSRTGPQQQMEFAPEDQHLPEFASGRGYMASYQYASGYPSMKKELLDPSYDNTSRYHVPEGQLKLQAIDPVDRRRGSSLGGDSSTYDALYRQASRAEGGHVYGVDKRRKMKTCHRLPSSSGRDESDDMTQTIG